MQVVRRNTELGLVLLAGLITVGGYVLASLGTNASLPANLVPFLLFILASLPPPTSRLGRWHPRRTASSSPSLGS